MLEHLERAERHAELFARLRVFKRGLIQFADRADRLGALRGDRSLAAAFQRLNRRAFRPNKLPAGTRTPSSLISAARRPSSVLKPWRCRLGAWRSTMKRADALTIVLISGCPGGNDQFVSPRSRDHDSLGAAQHVAVRLAFGRRRYRVEIMARPGFQQRQRPDGSARDDAGEKVAALRLRCRALRSGRRQALLSRNRARPRDGGRTPP